MNMRSIQIFVLLRTLERAILVIALSLLLIFAVQKELATYLYESLLSVPNVQIYGPAPSQTVHRAPLCSFNVENVHPTDIAEILDLQVCSKFCTFLILVRNFIFRLQQDFSDNFITPLRSFCILLIFLLPAVALLHCLDLNATRE